MTTAKGHLVSIAATLRRLARTGNVEALRAYISSEAFLVAFVGLDATRRGSAMRAYAAAEALSEAKALRPLVRPKTIAAKRAEKTDWRDAAMRKRLADAYARVGDDDENVLARSE